MKSRLLLLLVLLSTPGFLRLHSAPSGSYADWRLQVWRSGLAAIDSVSGPAADPDDDGLANFAEYALGLDPSTRDAAGTAAWQRSADGAEFALSVRSATAAREAALAAAWTADLDGAAWSGPDGTNLVVVTGGAGAASTDVDFTFRLTSAERGFARVSAETVVPPAPTQAWVWFEAEPPNEEANTSLSNGQMTWIVPGGSIQKTVTVPADGVYQLWVRKFWNPQAFRWRAGTNDTWKDVARRTSLVDLVVLGTNTSRRVGWFNAGPVTLEAGVKTFRLEVPGTATDTTAYDCFLLTREVFTARGKLKPDEGFAVEQPGWFAFQPEVDVFSFSPIDLRWLNERVAGDDGFIRVQGEDFVHGRTGARARFWGVNAGAGVAGLAKNEVDLFARSLAKRGVNLVRYHGPVYATSGTNLGEVDAGAVANLHYLIAALKREGIYTSLSIYFPLWVTLNPGNTLFPGYTNQNPFALLYANTNFQAVYRGWWEHLMSATNVHTGLPLKDEPALAWVELVNEDSTLFWTFDAYRGEAGNIPDPLRAILEKRFGDWLLTRYAPRTLTNVVAQVWSGTASPHDNLGAGRVGFRSLSDIFNHRTRRDQDTARFLTELMRDFYQETVNYLRADLNCRSLITASNWKTASSQYLDALDKYANNVADFFDRHGYFGSYHYGTDASWMVTGGQVYDDRAAATFQRESGAGEDQSNPVFDLIHDGRPSTISEINWPMPNRYRADMAILGAAYGSLQGEDALCWFAAVSPTWDTLPGKFPVQTPVGQGQFPAAALLYRLGLVQTGPRVVDLELSVSDLYALKGSPVPAAQDFALLRGNDVPPGGVITNVAAIDSLAFLVGRVGVRFTTNTALRSRITDLSPFVDRTNKVVRSQTGELRWDYGRGLVSVNAVAAQGAAGFLRGAGVVDLADLSIESPMDYGSVLAVSLDGRPLADSAKLLIQVMSEEQPFGWQTSVASGQRLIVKAGEAPLMVRNLAGTVILKRADAASLTVSPLDANGYRILGAELAGGTITFRSDQFYYLVEK